MATQKVSKDWNGEYYFCFKGQGQRSWDDAVKYGFVSADGGKRFTGKMCTLVEGERIWAYVPDSGYVGVGIVIAAAKPAREAVLFIDGKKVNFYDLPLLANYSNGAPLDEEEYILHVKWRKTVPLDSAVWERGLISFQPVVAQPQCEAWGQTVRHLVSVWGIDDN